MGQVVIFVVRDSNIDQWWDKALPFVNKALEKGQGQYDAEDVRSMIEEGFGVMILAYIDGDIVAAMVSILDEFPLIRQMTILLMGGDNSDEWFDETMKAFAEIASEQQADVITVHGRRGWVRKLKQYGYEEIHTTVMKRL